jgi:hypothetical protein
MVQYATFLKNVDPSQEKKRAQEEPQQLPGTHPLFDGLLPQQVEPVTWPEGSLLIEMFGADISCSIRDPPQDTQTMSSEFRPMPTRSSLT